MVAFNPELPPSPEPNFTSYVWQGHPIHSIDPDKSGEIRGKALGEAIKGLTDVGDSVVKGAIDSKVHDAVDQNRDAFTSALNQYKDQQGAMTNSEKGQAQGMNLMSGEGTAPTPPAGSGVPGNSVPVTADNPPPAALQQGLSKVQTLGNAAASGKVNETYYYGNLLNAAKSLRAQFPGYRDYIDQKIASASGVNPANAYMQSILETVNQNATNKNKQAEFELHQALEAAKSAETSGNPATQGIFGLISSGQLSPAQGMSSINRANSTKWKWQNAVEQNAAENANKDIDKRKLAPDLDRFFFNTMADTEKATGSVHGLLSDQDLSKAINEQANGVNQKPSEFWQQQGVLRNQAKEKIKAYMYNQAAAPLAQDPQHRSAMDIFGKENVDQRINETLKQYDARTDMIAKGQPAMAELTKQLAEGQQADDVWQTRNSEFGQEFRKWEVLRGKAPPEVLNSFVNKAFINEGKMNAWTNRFKLGFATGSKNPDGSPTTYDQAFKTMKQQGVDSPKDYASIVRFIPQTADSKLGPDVKHDVYSSMFNPANTNFLSDDNLNSSVWDGHRWIPGKESVFNTVLSPNVLKDVKNTSQSTDPQLWNNTVDWAKKSFGQQIFNKEVIKLNEMVGTDLKWAYDDQTNQLIPLTKDGRPVPKNMGQPYQQNIARINMGLQSLSNVAKADGQTDVKSFLMQTLRESGVDMSQGNGKGIMQALSAEALMKKMKEDPEGAGKYIKQNTPGQRSDITPSNALGYNSEAPKLDGSLAGFKNFLESGGGAGGQKFSLENVAKKGVHTENINPTFRAGMEKAIADYAQESGRTPEISSLFRTREEQARAYLHYLQGGGLAAPPGHSRHEVGEAADLNTDAKFANWLKSGGRAAKYGMEFLPGRAGAVDPYHIQLSRKLANQ